MKTTYQIILLWFLFIFPITLSAQSDCPDAITVCSNSNYSGLNVTGFGIQELTTNVCESFEHHSIWLKILVKDGGTLGFTLTPESSNLVVDFDFWIFGPNVTCDNLGTAIRCSTTNPLNAQLDYNTTGMNDTETDVSEGDGEDGNSFVQWIDAEDDDIYYLIIDRPHGASNFYLEWTGTATFHDVPQFLNPDDIGLDMSQCDNDGTFDERYVFDLTVYNEMFIGEQTDVDLSFHLNLNDVTIGENALDNPENFTNSANPQTIYLRMTNTVTGCYSTEVFMIHVTDDIAQTDDIDLCDIDSDGFETFNLAHNDENISVNNEPVVYYASQQDAQNETNPIGPLYQNQVAYQSQQIWARTHDIVSNCPVFRKFFINLITLPEYATADNAPNDINKCNDGQPFNLTINQSTITGDEDDFEFVYYESDINIPNDNYIQNPEEYIATANTQTIYVHVTNTQIGCEAIYPFTINTIDLVPGQPEDIFLCDDAQNGLQNFDLTANDGIISNGQQGVTVSYHVNEGDANNNTNAIGPEYQNAQPYTPQVIWVRIDMADCYDVSSFTIDVIPLPVINNPDNILLDMSKCDSDSVDDDSTSFDLTVHESVFLGNQSDIEFLYYSSLQDVADGNKITTPDNYNNITNPQTIYVQPHNTVTGCYGNAVPFTIEVVNTIMAGTPPDLWLCDTNDNGIQFFNLTVNDEAGANFDPHQSVSYHSSLEDAENDINPLPILFNNQHPYQPQTVWVRVENTEGCAGYAITSFALNIYPVNDFDFTIETSDFSVSNNSINISIQNPENYLFSINGTTFTDITYYDNLPPGIYTVYISSADGCNTIEQEVALLNYPKFFSPNGDGINEYWNINYIHFFPDALVYIFDRYGKLIKSYRGSEYGWDGTFNGENLLATDYWFVARFLDGREIKGHFALIR